MATNEKEFLSHDGLKKYDKKIKEYIGSKASDKAKELVDGSNYVHKGIPSHSEGDETLAKILWSDWDDKDDDEKEECSDATITMEGDAAESYGISLSGDGCVIWNPGDTYLLAVADEDAIGQQDEGSIRFYIAGDGQAYRRVSTQNPDRTYSYSDHEYVTADKTFITSTVSGATEDANNYKTTGYYSVVVTTMRNMPTANHGLLFVDFKVGTPYQIFIPDNDERIFKRTYDTTRNQWNNWSNLLDFYHVPSGCEVIVKNDGNVINLDADEVVATGDIIVEDELKVDTIYTNKDSVITFEDEVEFRSGARFGSGDIVAEDANIYASGGDVYCKDDETYHYLSKKANTDDLPADNLIVCSNESSSDNADNCITNGMAYYMLTGSASPQRGQDGLILWVPWGTSTDYGHQFFMDDQSTTLMHRALDSDDGWCSWARIYDDDYHPAMDVSYGTKAPTYGSGLKIPKNWSEDNMLLSQYAQQCGGYSYTKVGNYVTILLTLPRLLTKNPANQYKYILPFTFKSGQVLTSWEPGQRSIMGDCIMESVQTRMYNSNTLYLWPRKAPEDKYQMYNTSTSSGYWLLDSSPEYWQNIIIMGEV